MSYWKEINREMGLLIEKNKDHEIFSDTLKEIESIKNSSVLEKSFKEEGATIEVVEKYLWIIEKVYDNL